MEIILWRLYCGDDIVEIILWRLYCGDDIVEMTLWRLYCGDYIVEMTLWRLFTASNRATERGAGRKLPPGLKPQGYSHHPMLQSLIK